MAEAKPTGTLFILTQPYANTISKEETLSALPSHLQKMPYEIIPVDINKGSLAALGEVDFIDLKTRQYEFFNKTVKPRLLAEPNRRVLYVGKAPIPLALHLGSLVESFELVDSLYFSHDPNNGNWYYDHQENSATEIVVTGPKGESAAPGDVIVKIETSFQISDIDVIATIPKPLASCSIQTNQIHTDSMNGPLTKVLIKNLIGLLTEINTKYPNKTGIHLFMAVPMGLAFEIGAALNPTIFHPIVSYQFFKGQTPPYRKAIVLGQDGTRNVSLSPEQKVETAPTIETWQQELKNLKDWSKILNISVQKLDPKPTKWIDAIFPEFGLGARLDSNFGNQTHLGESAIEDYEMATPFDAISTEFTFRSGDKKWIVGDYLAYHFWAASNQNKESLAQLVRLFLLHEAIHGERQRLKRENAFNVGRFARVLEEVDYQADIWAVCHELYFAYKIRNISVHHREFAMGLIKIIVGSFVAFDKAVGFDNGFQVRRLNRYLLWLWQYVLLDDQRKEVSLQKVVEILLNKPVIDLAGPQIACRNERIFMTLEEGKLVTPEMGIYHEGKFARYEGTSVIKVFDGLNNFDIEKMIEGLKELHLKV